MSVRFVLPIVFVAGFSIAEGASAEPVRRTDPFLTQFCVKCHNAETHKGDVRLHQLSQNVDEKNADLWKDVIHKIQRGEMPPKGHKQPAAEVRQQFLKKAITALDRYFADKSVDNDPVMRLTNKQIANSLQILLGVSRDISEHLIEDPVDKHGYSRQSELDVSAGYLGLYLPQLRKAVEDSLPDPKSAPDVYRITGNDWEKQHYLSGWSLSKRSRRDIYQGPRWLGDKFQIPLPPQHEFRMFIKDNRPEGDFRIKITVRNEPPTSGGKATEQRLTVYLDEGFMRPYKPVGNITVPVKKGPQEFELFGNVRDWVGVRLDKFDGPARTKQQRRQQAGHYRILSVQNNNALTGFPPPVKVGGADRSGNVYLVRPDDQWIAAFGPQRGLIPSYRGPAGAHPGKKGRTKAIYRDAMKTHGYVVIERIEFELPYLKSWPPASLAKYMAGGKIDTKSLPAKLRAFAAKAWRRPLDEQEAAYVNRLIADELAAESSELQALRNVVTIILSDARFLYLTRAGKTPRERNYELVSRLAYFLWDGPPDEKLLTLAARDAELDDATLLKEVDRLLASPRSDRFIESFTALWMGFRVFDQIAIDPNYYPKWRPTTKPHMKAESVAFFKELLRKDLSCLNLIDSDFVMINQRMAEHYGLQKVSGMDFSRVPAPKGRGGVLTQGAFLLAYSNGQDAHAVNRGVWLRSRILGDPPPDPPPNVPALADQKVVDVDGLSIKQRLERHRVGTCYDCHKSIDPWGIAMEGFDAIGLERSQILKLSTQGNRRRMLRLPVIDDVQIDGHKIDGMAALKQYLLKHHSDDFAYAFSRHLLSYALGRRPTYHDEKQLAILKARFKKDGYRMKSLIKAIVVSPAFRNTGGKQ